MRTLHVDPDREWRGGERQVFLLTRELARRGDEVLLAAAPASPLGGRARAAGVSVADVTIRGDLDPAAVLTLRRLLARFRPDVLHLHTARAHAAGGLAARTLGCGPVLVTRRLELPIGGPFSRWKYRALADHYVAISGAVESALIAGGVPAERITRIPSGVELPAEPGPGRPADRPPTVGTLAAFTAQKGPDTWADAVVRVCAERPDVRFVWAGEGKLRRAVGVRMHEAGLSERVTLPGFREDLSRFWEEIDVFFLPSTFEALGTAFLDALARGIPVVATRVGGIPEIVRDGREGLLAAPGDAAGLAAALTRVLDDRELARRLGAAGRERAADFAIGGVVDRVSDLYGRLAGSAS